MHEFDTVGCQDEVKRLLYHKNIFTRHKLILKVLVVSQKWGGRGEVGGDYPELSSQKGRDL